MWIRAGLALAIAAIVPTLYHWRPKKCRSKTLPPSQERVVILGASSLDGIGAAVARQCLARGCSNLMLVARREEALKLVKETLIHEQKDPAARASAEAIELFVADCSNVHDVFRLQTRIAEEFGGLDTLYIVFGALWTQSLLGVAGTDPTANPTAMAPTQDGLQTLLESVQAINNANITGTALVLSALLLRLQTNSKAPYVCVIGSLASLVPAPTRSLYCATKSAQQMLVQSVAAECASQAKVHGHAHVQFVVLAPSTVQTSFRSHMALTQGPLAAATASKGSLTPLDVAKQAVMCVEQGVTGVVPMPSKYFWVWLLSPLMYVDHI